ISCSPPTRRSSPWSPPMTREASRRDAEAADEEPRRTERRPASGPYREAMGRRIRRRRHGSIRSPLTEHQAPRARAAIPRPPVVSLGGHRRASGTSA
ncbi:MAG: hypothetical protein M3198_13645, partial [Actinomycetota bacterium]|nr:hypothetical protein [Actinomycetota bacterium]